MRYRPVTATLASRDKPVGRKTAKREDVLRDVPRDERDSIKSVIDLVKSIRESGVLRPRSGTASPFEGRVQLSSTRRR